MGLIGWTGRNLGLWLEVGTVGPILREGSGRKCSFGEILRPLVGPGWYEGPKRRCLGHCEAPGLRKRGEAEAEQREETASGGGWEVCDEDHQAQG